MGPLEEGSGHATGALKDAIDYQGSSVAFIQLIAAMDRDGEIDREIRGKRTYRISAAGDSSAAGSSSPSFPRPTARVAAMTTSGTATSVEIDYHRLAKALVSELLGFVADQTAPVVASDVAQADRDRLEAERNDYARRLEIAREKLDELLDRGVEVPKTSTVTSPV